MLEERSWQVTLRSCLPPPHSTLHSDQLLMFHWYLGTILSKLLFGRKVVAAFFAACSSASSYRTSTALAPLWRRTFFLCFLPLVFGGSSSISITSKSSTLILSSMIPSGRCSSASTSSSSVDSSSSEDNSHCVGASVTSGASPVLRSSSAEVGDAETCVLSGIWLSGCISPSGSFSSAEDLLLRTILSSGFSVFDSTSTSLKDSRT